MRAFAISILLVACSSPPHEMSAPDATGSSSTDAAAPPSDGIVSASCAGKTAQPVDATWTLTVGNLTRTVKVHVPASYDPAHRTPVVIDIHGRTSDASQQITISHANAKSDAEGFIVAHPQAWGSPTSWNSGGGCCDPAYSNHIDDTGFMAALLDELDARLCVDPDRVYAMGLSNGGYMDYRMACDLGDRIAAVGSVAGLLQGDCHPTRAMPVLQVHGTSDPIVSYSWVGATIDFWTQTNHCTTEQQTFHNGTATCVTHGGCTNGADVVLCTINGGGHQWPGGETLPFLGSNTNDLIATDAIWEFFVAHPR